MLIFISDFAVSITFNFSTDFVCGILMKISRNEDMKKHTTLTIIIGYIPYIPNKKPPITGESKLEIAPMH